MGVVWFGLGLALLTVVGAYVWELRHRGTRAMEGGLHPEIDLPYEQEFELYHNGLSLCSKKARVCMSELGIPYAGRHVHLIETGGYENIGRAFLSVNPAGIVPVLVHRGHPIYESHDIIRYAAEHAPAGAPALVPDDPSLESLMQTWVDCASLTGDDPIAESRARAGNCVPGLTVPLFAAMIPEIPYRAILEGLLFHRLKIRPLLFLMLKLRGLERLGRTRQVVDVIRRSREHLAGHLDALEKHLAASGGAWIVGDTYTLADVSWVVIFERLREADSLHVFLGDGRRPETTAYWERLRARPSYTEAILAHGHPSIERGLERLRAAKAADPELRAAFEGVGAATNPA